jgi:cytoskeleton protein RodZ
MSELPPPPVDTGLSLGDRLRSGRRARAMSLEQAARALHLEESVLAAIEDGRFADAGAVVFVRGHLRSYARLLGLDEDAVLAAYRSADPASQATPRMTRERERPLETRLPPLALGAGVAVAVLAVVVWMATSEAPTPAPPAPVVATVPPAPVVPAASIAAPLPPAESVAVVGAEPGEAPPDAPPDAPPPRTPGTTRVEFLFEQPSWIRVEAGGQRLVEGEQGAGTAQVVDGVPPMDVTLGNAPGVRIRVNDRAYALPEGVLSPGSNVARFRIGATGAIPAPGPGPAPPAASEPSPAAGPGVAE